MTEEITPRFLNKDRKRIRELPQILKDWLLKNCAEDLRECSLLITKGKYWGYLIEELNLAQLKEFIEDEEQDGFANRLAKEKLAPAQYKDSEKIKVFGPTKETRFERIYKYGIANHLSSTDLMQITGLPKTTFHTIRKKVIPGKQLKNHYQDKPDADILELYNYCKEKGLSRAYLLSKGITAKRYYNVLRRHQLPKLSKKSKAIVSTKEFIEAYYKHVEENKTLTDLSKYLGLSKDQIYRKRSYCKEIGKPLPPLK
jgi:hypothetical protein